MNTGPDLDRDREGACSDRRPREVQREEHAPKPAQYADSVRPEDVAELLRLADFALDRSTVSMLAFTDKVHTVSRDCERNQEVRRQIKAMLDHLPPKPPLTPEREEECREIIGRVLRRIDGGDDAPQGL